MIKYWFDYKTVIISGASSGIGKMLAKRLIKDHCCKVIGIGRSEQKLRDFSQELGYMNHRFSWYAFDVSRKEKWQELYNSIVKEGIKPDILINCAGVLPEFDRFERHTAEEAERIMQINFFSVVYSMELFLPLLLESENAAIINISSGVALCPFAGTSAYAASKAAMKAFTDAVREEIRGRCYISLVCPGFTKTDIFRNQGAKSRKAHREIDLICTDCDKIVNRIIKGMQKKKSDPVYGADAHIINIGNKLFGTFCCDFSSKALKLSGFEIFKDILR